MFTGLSVEADTGVPGAAVTNHRRDSPAFRLEVWIEAWGVPWGRQPRPCFFWPLELTNLASWVWSPQAIPLTLSVCLLDLSFPGGIQGELIATPLRLSLFSSKVLPTDSRAQDET